MYPEEQQRELLYALHRSRSQALDLISTLASRSYVTDAGAEYGKHGLARRISTLRHCVGQVFDALPLDGDLPVRHKLMDATVSLQAFFINIFGALDNLARVWINESGRFEGVEVRPTDIGLGPRREAVRASLPADVLGQVREFDDWFGYVENYRHALAHRIPLYIPSRQYRPTESQEWTRLDELRWTAIREHRFEDLKQLEAAMHELGTFAPFMMHSFEEPAVPMAVHPQMLCDIATIIDLTERLLPHLPSPG
jgi:hypothetical protein